MDRKTLVIILHYNTPELTDNLYSTLISNNNSTYDIEILDNGSDVGKTSKYATLKVDTNYFFGGGLNMGIKYALDNKDEYDSLLFMNSDLIVGHNFIQSLIEQKKKTNATIISPAIIEPNYKQCHWKQMHQWNTGTNRKVRWIDFQCPLFDINFLVHIKQYPNELLYGWGQDVLSGIICEKNNWSIYVSDIVTCLHLNSQTINQNIEKPEISEYNRKAESNMFNYFQTNNLVNPVNDLRKYGEEYKININSN